MNNFVATAASRETSEELMRAILTVAANDETEAARVWESPTDAELCAIVEIVTKNGMFETSDFCWGVNGTNWA